jgi:hypothetical protein
MYSNKQIKKIKDNIKSLDLTAGLTDAQVVWVKDKVEQIESWKDTAVTSANTMNTRITALETKAGQFQAALVDLTARVKALEAK